MDSAAAPAGRAVDHPGAASLGAVPVLVGRARDQAALREEFATAIGDPVDPATQACMMRSSAHVMID